MRDKWTDERRAKMSSIHSGKEVSLEALKRAGKLNLNKSSLDPNPVCLVTLDGNIHSRYPSYPALWAKALDPLGRNVQRYYKEGKVFLERDIGYIEFRP